MKDMKKEKFEKEFIPLPDSIKNQIENDVRTIKSICTNDIEYADKTIGKLLKYHNRKENYEDIRQHLHQRYIDLQKTLKDKITIEHFNDCNKLKMSTFDLMSLIDNKHELVESYLDSIGLMRLGVEGIYLRNQISDEIQKSYYDSQISTIGNISEII
jgi:hypothetical protein